MSAITLQASPDPSSGRPARGGRSAFGLPLWQSRLYVGAALLLFAFALWAVLRMGLGYAPATPYARALPLIVHLGTIIPAIPLGAYILATRKGGARHKTLGKIWMALMITTAISTLFLRQINEGSFSFVHIFSVLTLIVAPLAILAARRGDVAAHKKHVTGLFIGALLVAGAFTFLPGRTMWVWAFG